MRERGNQLKTERMRIARVKNWARVITRELRVIFFVQSGHVLCRHSNGRHAYCKDPAYKIDRHDDRRVMAV
jgi:hypothetical protein